MEIKRIGDRGAIFTFKDPYFTNSFVITTNEQIIICDTFCGPDSMKEIRKFIEQDKGLVRQLVIFNSHYHYDHIWGNCEFPDESIYAHSLCYNKILENGERDLKSHAKHTRGEVKLTLPNQLFTSNVLFDDGRIMLFHSPGHTIDSSSCIDYEDGVLFVGDNVETPFPYIYDSDIDQYIATLVEYVSMDWKYLVAGHDPLMLDARLIESNIDYLEQLRDWEVNLVDLDRRNRSHHIMNLAFLTKSLERNEIEEHMEQRMHEAIEFLDSLDSSETIEQLKAAFNQQLSEEYGS